MSAYTELVYIPDKQYCHIYTLTDTESTADIWHRVQTDRIVFLSRSGSPRFFEPKKKKKEAGIKVSKTKMKILRGLI